MFTKLHRAILTLFDGAAAGGEGGGSQGANINAATPGSTKGEDLSKVKYGKQPADPESEAAAQNKGEGNPDGTPKKTPFSELIKGEYKEEYTKATQQMIDKRFKETKNLEAKLGSVQPLIDTLALKYGLQADDIEGISKALDSDSEFLAAQAEEKGMTVEQFKIFHKLEAENNAMKAAKAQAENQQKADEQIQKWMEEAEELKKTYPDFDLQAEITNDEFAGMLKHGISVAHAYEVIHLNEIKSKAVETAKTETQKAVTANIRAKGNRPNENGTEVGSAFIVKDDVHKLTKRDRAEAIKRAQRGETIEF